MGMIIYKCSKCGAIQQLPENFDDEEPCMFCGGRTERQD